MKNNSDIPDLSKLANSKDLAYFISLQEPEDSSARKWDKRTESWNKQRLSKQKNDERVISTLSYLEQKGLLQSHFDVADIGCGPGRFAAAFARRVHRVIGLDISEKMVAHGMEYIRRENLDNALLYACDFQSLDIEKEGYKGAFDLVFSSMTPAVHGMDALVKSMEMSRGWCCNMTHLDGRSLLQEQIMEKVFNRKAPRRWTGKWFYSLFNTLFLLGYDPETSYENRHQELWIRPDEEYVNTVMEHLLPLEETTPENAKKILNWLKSRQNQDGMVLDIVDSTYGRILWNVSRRTERPDFHKHSARHVFLTGPKQVGKSTLIKNVLNQHTGKIGGFLTVRTDSFLENGFSVHLLPMEKSSVPSQDNLLFVCGKSDDHTAERFNVLGSGALSVSSDCSLIIMDELGPHETNAAQFRQAVFDTLDGNIPVLGVLQSPAESFWPDILSRPDVEIIEVTKENRDQILLKLLSQQFSLK